MAKLREIHDVMSQVANDGSKFFEKGMSIMQHTAFLISPYTSLPYNRYTRARASRHFKHTIEPLALLRVHFLFFPPFLRIYEPFLSPRSVDTD